MIGKQAAALLLVACCLAVATAPVRAQTPAVGLPGSQLPVQPGDHPLFQSPLAPPAAGTATMTGSVTPTVLPSPTPTDTPAPTTTPTATASATASATPSATPTATIAPLQVSPLVAQTGNSLPDNDALLWIGAAALIILAGSAILVVAERRQDR